MRRRIARSALGETANQPRARQRIQGRANRWLWRAVVCASIVLILVGVFDWMRLLDGERGLRAANLVPPHRGASTTLVGMAIGLGLGGLILGAAALMSTRK